MAECRKTHILFDFFGTLVDYSPSRTRQGYERSHDVVQRLGAALEYDAFLASWSAVSERFDRLSAVDGREFPMTDIGGAFLLDVLGRPPTPPEIDMLVDTYLAEWNTGVRHLPGIGELLRGLGADYRLAVVSNTSDTRLVPGHLETMAVRDCFDAVVLSLDVGWRKPNPAIYKVALDQLWIEAHCAVFVGDTFAADYSGPTQAGMLSFLIDPHHAAPVPDASRLSSIFDLPGRLAELAERRQW